MRCQILTEDFRSIRHLEDNTADLIVTDPSAGNLAQYEDLAIMGSRVLRPWAVLIAYTPNNAMSQILEVMSRHLRYWWTICLELDDVIPVEEMRVLTGWKPLVLFVKDVPQCEDPDKRLYDSQDISEVIHQLCPPDGLVVDPMCGSGDIILAALSVGRCAIGMETDPDKANVARGRVTDAFGAGSFTC